MKKFIVLLIALGIMALACEKGNETGSEPDKMQAFDIAFILTDSAGNNLLPFDLPDNPVFDPNKYHAHSEWNESIGSYNRNSTYGHVFRMYAPFHRIRNSKDFKKDSLFKFYPCFGQDCDTVIIHKRKWDFNDTLAVECFAKK